jgi:hypothetical protein
MHTQAHTHTGARAASAREKAEKRRKKARTQRIKNRVKARREACRLQRQKERALARAGRPSAKVMIAVDVDGDGIPDYMAVDVDGDGVPDDPPLAAMASGDAGGGAITGDGDGGGGGGDEGCADEEDGYVSDEEKAVRSKAWREHAQDAFTRALASQAYAPMVMNGILLNQLITVFQIDSGFGTRDLPDQDQGQGQGMLPRRHGNNNNSSNNRSNNSSNNESGGHDEANGSGGALYVPNTHCMTKVYECALSYSLRQMQLSHRGLSGSHMMHGPTILTFLQRLVSLCGSEYANKCACE